MSQEEEAGLYARTQGIVDTGGCSQPSGVHQAEPLQSQVRASRDRRWAGHICYFSPRSRTIQSGPSPGPGCLMSI